MIESNYKYSQSICLDFCKYDLMLSKNVCPHLDSSIRIPNKINCPPKNLSKRSIEEEQNSQMAANFYNLSYYEKECYEKCPLECKKIKYSSDVSILPLSNTFTEYIESLGLLRKYEKLYDRQKLFKNLISIRISFSSMSQLNYVESPTMGLFDLISNLGGTLGLFLGINIILMLFFVKYINH